MCNFKSAIVMKNGDLLHNPWTDSHEDLVQLFKLNDTATPAGEARFCRVGFKPESASTAGDVDTYKLWVEETIKPEWFGDAQEKSTIEKLRLIVSGMIITGAEGLLCGGAYILAKGAKIDCVKNARILFMCDSSRIEVLRDSSSVGELRDSSRVGTLYDSSSIGVLRGSSRVEVLHGSSSIGVLYDSSSIGVLYDSSSVKVLLDSSRVGELYDSSRVDSDLRKKS
jgi:hypothetical protein